MSLSSYCYGGVFVCIIIILVLVSEKTFLLSKIGYLIIGFASFFIGIKSVVDEGD